jgi:ATP-dependent 26S proteasome regulatory subunit
LRSILNLESKQSDELLARFFDIADSGSSAAQARKAQELQEMIDGISQGPQRLATFVDLQLQGQVQKAIVRLEEGATAFPVLMDAHLSKQLKCGDNVILDSHAKAIIGLANLKNGTGEEAYFKRCIGPQHIEVALRGDERHVYRAADGLMKAIESADVEPGNRILVCPHRRMAFSHLPDENGYSGFRFLDRSRAPDVDVIRDMAAPPAFIREISEMVQLEMTDPEKRRRYGLRPCVMKLLTGMPGTGKSFAIYGLIREIYTVISRVSQTPIEDLPSRVMRLKASTVLSQWLGKSEKNIARFFNEIEQLAMQPFVSPEGKEFHLPVIVVLEEIDGLARHRGQEPVMDRIFTTLLELFDPTRRQVRENFIVFLGTTNKPHLIDSGFLRRIGGTIERFSILGRAAFGAVLEKQLSGNPLALEDGFSYPEGLSRLIQEITSWLFCPNGEDSGQVSLFFFGSSEPEIRFRRDFMNPGLVDRAVQQAAQRACSAEAAGCDNPGLTSTGLKAAIDDQIQAIVNVLGVDNADSYLELPEGKRIQSVQKIRQPEMLQAGILRAA